MTRLATAMLQLLLLAVAGLGQVTEIRYPPLAAAAQVQGDVRLHSGPEGIVLISGPPLLAQAAIFGMRALGSVSERGEVEVVFHFSLSKTTMREFTTTVKIGDAFDRFILRALGLKTERTVREKRCAANTDLPENRIDFAKTPIEVWVYESSRCLIGN